ncbi:hypothetical protein T484DRAFT_2163091 [Baffinella frigidus]|nr:hypothetical protein T484DRAFT_2163091 [Cryptophyta sp. CCMP2293]
MFCCPACILACVLPSPLRACEQRAMVPSALLLSHPAPACLLGCPHLRVLYCSRVLAHSTDPVWGCALLLPHVDLPIHLPCLPLYHYRHSAPMPSPPPHPQLRTQCCFSVWAQVIDHPRMSAGAHECFNVTRQRTLTRPHPLPSLHTHRQPPNP